MGDAFKMAVIETGWNFFLFYLIEVKKLSIKFWDGGFITLECLNSTLLNSEGRPASEVLKYCSPSIIIHKLLLVMILTLQLAGRRQQ